MDDNIRRLAEQVAENNKDLFYFWKYSWSFFADDLTLHDWIDQGSPRLYGED